MNAHGTPCSAPGDLAARETPVGRLGQREAGLIIEDRNDGVEVRVPASNLLEMSSHHLARRQPAGAQQARETAQAEVADVICGADVQRTAGVSAENIRSIAAK